MASSSQIPEGVLIAGRYRVAYSLGRGGMAHVYKVHEQRSGEPFALKLLRASQRQSDKVNVLFQREYQTLVQLAHPRIVRAYEYGIAEHGPYYTMELLESGDLSSAAPLPWRRACLLLRDAASALAVVHSRRLVHRDVTPTNVHLTPDGRGKLIDFGAVLPMGVSSSVVGTLPFVAPEAFHKQPLDGRADLYSLGALAYYLLTGQHAYPARTLAQLRELWRNVPRSPEQLAPDVPSGLSSLVMSLLSLEVLARPTNASELIDRLTALAELPADEELGQARAYLVMPSLTGREAELQDMRGKLTQAMRGHGSAVCIEGAAGVGRSRLLASFALEARTLGMTVLTADPSDAALDFGAVRALLARLFEAEPECRSEMPAVLAELAPGAAEIIAGEALQRLRADARGALVPWLLQIAQRRPLFIAVDDVQLCDSASCAVLAELLLAAPHHRLIVAITACGGDPDRAGELRILRRAAQRVRLAPLDVEQTHALIRSVFGDASHLRRLAHFMQAYAHGNPAAIMTLAQHLFDQGHARYQAGRWVLPADPHSLRLSDALRHALHVRVDALSQPARALAEALSLADASATIELHDFARLIDGSDMTAVVAAVSELLGAELLRPRGRSYAISQPAISAALRERIDDAHARRLHARLASIYLRPDASDTFMAAYHLQRAGESGRARALLVSRAQQLITVNERVAAPIHVRYRLGAETYERALQDAERSGAGPIERLSLLRGLLLFASQHDPQLGRYGPPVLDQLAADTGLVHWDELADLEPLPRVLRCLQLAKQRYDALPEKARGLDPGEAVRALAGAALMLSSAYGRLFDVDAQRTAAAASAALRPLATPLDVFAEIVAVSCAGSAGLEVADRCAALLDRIHEPDLAGHLVVKRALTTMRYYLGVWESRRGGERALEHARLIATQRKELEAAYPDDIGLGRYHSWHVRLLVHLYNGDVTRAQLCREQIDLLQLDGLDSLVAQNMRTSVYMEARAFAITDSVLELKGAIEVMAELAACAPGWRPLLHWARGHYQRQLGDFAAARAELEQALALSAPGRHLAWSWAATALVEVLIGGGDYAQACAWAERARVEFDAVPMSIPVERDLQRVHALALAHGGDVHGAAARLDALLPLAAEELGGVPLGQMYEARARIAVLARDPEAFELNITRVRELYGGGGHPGLWARLQRLRELGRSVFGVFAAAHPAEERAAVEREPAASRSGDASGYERARAALSLLIEQSGARSGCLFEVDGGRVRLAAFLPAAPWPAELQAYVQELVDQDTRDLSAVRSEAITAPPYGDGGVITTIAGVSYHAFELRAVARSGPSLLAIAVLAAPTDGALRLSWQLARAVSSYLGPAAEAPAPGP